MRKKVKDCVLNIEITAKNRKHMMQKALMILQKIVLGDDEASTQNWRFNVRYEHRS